MKTPISLLWATPADAATLASLHGTLFDTPWTTESFAAMADDPGSLLLVARTAGQPEPLAFIAGRVMADEAEVLMLAVRADAQRTGIGRLLVEGVARAAKRAGAASIYLEVAADNVPAIGLYRACGFSETGRRANYYSTPGGPARDALVLALPL